MFLKTFLPLLRHRQPIGEGVYRPLQRHLPKRPAGKCNGGVQNCKRFLIFDRASDVWRKTIGCNQRKQVFNEETHTKRHRHTGDCHGK